jgi:hypothetical protein
MKRLSKKIENLFLAITFAEAGEAETAGDFLRGEDRHRVVDHIVHPVRHRKELKAPGARKR